MLTARTRLDVMLHSFLSRHPRAMRFISRLHQRLWLTRAKTLGVRAIVLDGDKVFLVRHTYLPGWYLPGGGVDRGETPATAAVRELREEGGLRAEEPPRLFGVYRNGRHDYVFCYIILRVSRIADRLSDWEIAETGFFPLDALPEGATRATRARLREWRQALAPSEDW